MHSQTLPHQKEFEAIQHTLKRQSAEIITLRIENQKTALLSELKGSRALSEQINTLMTTIQAQAYEKIQGEVTIAIEAFSAKGQVLGALLKDCFETFGEIRDSIPIPEIKINNIRETLTTVLNSPKRLSPEMYDVRNVLFRSRFGRLSKEEQIINNSIKKTLASDPDSFQREGVAETFQTLFARQFQEIERVKYLFEVLKYGKYKEPIEMYFIKQYAVNLFKHHVRERQKHIRSKFNIAAKSLTPHPSKAKINGYDKKGAVIMLAQFIFKTLDIQWPYKATLLSGTLSTKRTEEILKTVIEAESHLTESLEKTLQTLLQERELRPWSARQNPDDKVTFDNEVNTQRFSDALLNHRTIIPPSLKHNEDESDSDIEEVFEFENEDESKQLFRCADSSPRSFISTPTTTARSTPCFFKTDLSMTKQGGLNQKNTHHIKRKI